MKTITRIDLEELNPNLTRVKQYFEGWREGDTTPDIDQTEQASIYRLLMGYEKQGFTCSMRDREHGQALRGEITRVDIIQLPEGWQAKEYPYGWEPKTHPLTTATVTETAANEWANSLEAKGWVVRRWVGGMRAFKGDPRPVRDRAGIMAVRRQAEAEFQRRENIGANKIFYDFAYDY